ncbi:MAG: hypothetical protein DCF31_02995 [Alphaproteobacteria bacterium]|nr:MAG: hypothetical protein DCF31_02995 [Alphaproteobacteria bacterium]
MSSLYPVEAASSAHDDRFYILANTMLQMVWSTLPDGYHDYYNARWYEFTGMPAGSTDGEGWSGMFHPEDQERARDRWQHSLDTGEPYDIEYRLRSADGEYRWVLGRALPMRGPDGRITRWFGTCTDIHDHKLALEQREIISHELSHRIKNIFSVIGGLVGMVTQARPELQPVADELRERILSLGRAHDFVRPHSAASAPAQPQGRLHGMLGQLLAPYGLAGRTRITVRGEDPDIDDRSATPLALVFHELATNAAKYGSLSTLVGTVDIDLRSVADGVSVVWTEQGGPAVVAPLVDGFGARLMQLSVVRQLGGKIDRDWRPEGLVVTLTIPKAALRRRSPPGTA